MHWRPPTTAPREGELRVAFVQASLTHKHAANSEYRAMALEFVDKILDEWLDLALLKAAAEED
jgi:hypothetical protein